MTARSRTRCTTPCSQQQPLPAKNERQQSPHALHVRAAVDEEQQEAEGGAAAAAEVAVEVAVEAAVAAMRTKWNWNVCSKCFTARWATASHTGFFAPTVTTTRTRRNGAFHRTSFASSLPSNTRRRHR